MRTGKIWTSKSDGRLMWPTSETLSSVVAARAGAAKQQDQDIRQQEWLLSNTTFLITDTVFDSSRQQPARIIWHASEMSAVVAANEKRWPKNMISHQYHFCRDKQVLVATRQNTSFIATKVCLSRQNFCRDKIMYCWQKKCRNKYLSRQTRVCGDKTFVATKVILA